MQLDEKGVVRLAKFTFWFFVPIVWLVAIVSFHELYYMLYRYFVKITTYTLRGYDQEIVLLMSLMCSGIVVLYAYRKYKIYCYNKNIFKWSWVPYALTLLFCVIYSRIFDPNGSSYIWPTIITFIFPYTLIYSIIRIIIDNRPNVSRIINKLSIIPLVIIGSYVLLMFTSGIFHGAGAWWILYAILAICPITALVLYIVGWATNTSQTKEL
jgi:hypothetical protein